MVTTNTNNNVTTIVLSPNRSTEWKDIKKWLLFISMPAIIVALAWLFVGVWIILPFAVLELSLLTYIMYSVCYRNYRQQIITIEGKNVTFSSGIGKISREYIFTKPDCYLAVTTPKKPIDTLELALKNDLYSIPVGEFLNPEDRAKARRKIRAAGVIEVSSRWWAN
jgi:uncharacterized membrane protein